MKYQGFRIGYEWGPIVAQSGYVYVIAENSRDARRLARVYLEERGLWERVGELNLYVYHLIDEEIPAGEEIIF